MSLGDRTKPDYRAKETEAERPFDFDGKISYKPEPSDHAPDEKVTEAPRVFTYPNSVNDASVKAPIYKDHEERVNPFRSTNDVADGKPLDKLHIDKNVVYPPGPHN